MATHFNGESERRISSHQGNADVKMALTEGATSRSGAHTRTGQGMCGET